MAKFNFLVRQLGVFFSAALLHETGGAIKMNEADIWILPIIFYSSIYNSLMCVDELWRYHAYRCPLSSIMELDVTQIEVV